MKAVVYTKYGSPDLLELKEVEKPVPKDNEVLVKVRASTVTPMDWHLRQPGMNIIARMIAGLIKPKNPILGVEFAGEVEAIGKDVWLLKKGDQVFGGGRPGAHAEYVCMPEDEVAIKPSNMTFEEAAGIHFATCVALMYLRDHGHIQSGQKVLINGASGGVGTFAVQLAKYFGAEVTGVCSAINLALVKSIGADRVIDYKKEDFTKEGKTYDIIFDAVGKRSFSQCRKSLNQNGIYLSTVATLPLILQMLWTSKVGTKKAKFVLQKATKEDLIFLKDLIEAGKLRTVIDRVYPLEQVAEAHSYSENGHAKGKIIIKII